MFSLAAGNTSALFERSSGVSPRPGSYLMNTPRRAILVPSYSSSSSASSSRATSPTPPKPSSLHNSTLSPIKQHDKSPNDNIPSTYVSLKLNSPKPEKNSSSSRPHSDEVQEALRLLQKSDERKKERLKKKLDSKIQKEVTDWKRESEIKKQKRLEKLLEEEQLREKQAKAKLEMIEKYSYDLFLKKSKLLKKLSEMELKQQVNTLSIQMLGSEQEIDTEAIFSKVRKEAKQIHDQIVDMTVPESREILADEYIHFIEEFSRVSSAEELKQVKENLEEYLQPEINRRNDWKKDSKIQLQHTVQATKEQIISGWRQDLQNALRSKMENEHKQKSIYLHEGKDAVAFDKAKINDLLNLPIVKYETDIGVADAEMEEIRDELGKVAAMHEEFIKQFNATVQANEQTVTTLKQQIATSQENIKTYTEAINVIKKELNEYDEKGLRQKIAVLENNISQTKNQFAKTKAEADALQLEIDNDSEMNDRKATLNQLTDSYEAQYKMLQESIADLEAVIGLEKAREKEREKRVEEQNNVNGQVEAEKKDHYSKLQQLRRLMNQALSIRIVNEDLIPNIQNQILFLQHEQHSREQYLKITLDKELTSYKTIQIQSDESLSQALIVLSFLKTVLAFEKEPKMEATIPSKYKMEAEKEQEQFDQLFKDLVTVMCSAKNKVVQQILKDEVLDEIAEWLYEWDEKKMTYQFINSNLVYDNSGLEELNSKLNELRMSVAEKVFKEQRLLAIIAGNNIPIKAASVDATVLIDEPYQMDIVTHGKLVEGKPCKELSSTPLKKKTHLFKIRPMLSQNIKKKEQSVKELYEPFLKVVPQQYSSKVVQELEVRVQAQVQKVKEEELRQEALRTKLLEIQQKNEEFYKMQPVEKRQAINLLTVLNEEQFREKKEFTFASDAISRGFSPKRIIMGGERPVSPKFISPPRNMQSLQTRFSSPPAEANNTNTADK